MTPSSRGIQQGGYSMDATIYITENVLCNLWQAHVICQRQSQFIPPLLLICRAIKCLFRGNQYFSQCSLRQISICSIQELNCFRAPHLFVSNGRPR